MRVNPRLLTLPAAATMLLLAAGSAWAHVHVDADHAEAGATNVTLTFHVPNEELSAQTTGLRVFLPTDHPLAGVTAAPQNGWIPQISASEITWSGGSISGTDTMQFRVGVAQLPTDVSSLTFKAIQTYSNGDVVSWIETAAPGSAEPEHPAAVLALGAAAGQAVHHHPSVTATAAPPASSGPNWTALIGGGSTVALALLASAAVAVRRRGRRATVGAPHSAVRPKDDSAEPAGRSS
jgi:uncharacterized protein YcnI